MIVAVVMVLQRLEGLSDREAVERFSFDVRWKYAAGGLDLDHPGFAHTVLVDMRARLARSERPARIFEVALDAARGAGLVGRRRVLDPAALYDAVTTMDTVILLRSGIRGLLSAAADRQDALRALLLRRDDDYASGGKPACDWDDRAAREVLIDALARDASALLGALDGEALPDDLAQAATLLATLVGQDLEITAEGTFRIARRVAPDRVISTVDPDARHGHKTAAHGFDGYKGHVALDPDSEILTATAVTTAHEMAELALDLRPGGPVVGLPGGIASGGTGSHELRLVGTGPDAPTPPVRGAGGDQGATGAGPPEGGHGTRGDGPQRSDPAGRAGDRARLRVDREVVLAEATGGSHRRLDLDADGGPGGLQRIEQLATAVGG